MALTRSYLKSMGLTEEQVNAIIENHTDSIDGLKAELATAKAAAASVDALTKERDEYKDKLSKAGDAAKVQADFDAYKQKVETEKVHGQKMQAYDALLKDVGVARDSFRQTLCKAVDVDAIELDDKGAIKDAEAIRERIRTEYADFVGTVEPVGTPPANPPSGGVKTYTREQIAGMSPDEINKNWDAVSKSLAALK